MATRYEISNRASGQSLGLYEAASPEEAVLALTIDAGYTSLEDAARRLDMSVEAYVNEFLVVADQR